MKKEKKERGASLEIIIMKAELRRRGTLVERICEGASYWYLLILFFFFRRYHQSFSLAVHLHLLICHHLISSSIQLETNLKEMVVGPEIAPDCQVISQDTQKLPFLSLNCPDCTPEQSSEAQTPEAVKILYGPPLCPGTTTGVPHFGLILYGLEYGLTAKISQKSVRIG